MKRFGDLSYRVKIPLAIIGVIVATELVVGAMLVNRAFNDARRDLEASSRNLAAVLARSLRDPIVRDDVWQAFEVVRTPVDARGANSALQAIVVVGIDGRVFVSSDPVAFPMLSKLEDLPGALVQTASAVDVSTADDFRFVYLDQAGETQVAAGMRVRAEDGSPLGLLLLQFDTKLYVQRIHAAVAELVLITVPGLLLLLPLGWWWGKRMAEPLAALAATMRNVGDQPAAELIKGLPATGSDEIGAVSDSARRMLASLAEKEALERQMVSAERLAAVGRVSAAMAHEINNPLGGMLNSIDTLEKHGHPDLLTARTLGLLRRGLQQIRATVSALLIEARLDSPEISPQDWDDLKTLIEPQVAQRSIRLNWQVRTMSTLPLPAHQVRQLSLNLLLNAIKAVEAGGVVKLTVEEAGGDLCIEVGNTGAPISSEQLAHLFEPFAIPSERDGRRSLGLGLWVCYQVTMQLGGAINATSEAGWTLFRIRLPIRERLQEAA